MITPCDPAVWRRAALLFEGREREEILEVAHNVEKFGRHCSPAGVVFQRFGLK